MVFLLTTIHLIVCVFLILVVLLQTGKGADVAAAFGGTSQTACGARGAATLLSKLTTGSAIIFMFTSFTLAILANQGSSSRVPKDAGTQQQQSAPVPLPTTPPAPTELPQNETQTPPPAQQQPQ